MKERKNIFKAIITLLLVLCLSLGIGVRSIAAEDDTNSAADSNESETVESGGGFSQENGQFDTFAPESEVQNGDEKPKIEEKSDEGGDIGENVFEEIYAALEQNADKIFSILAFVGTLLVGIGYKSGLLPLLREAIAKLKGSIDGVKADGELSRAKTDERLAEVSRALERIDVSLAEMKLDSEKIEDMARERKSIGLLLEGQIDMLYSIFMTSALPQYQKDEVGEKISLMREELKIYEQGTKN